MRRDAGAVETRDVGAPDADGSDGGEAAAATPVRVLIADDAPDARFLLRVWLERHGAMDVVAEATDGVEAVEQATREHPDLVILDVSMPRMDGLEAAAEIRRALPDARIVLFSAFSAERMRERAFLAGADVYLEKKCGPEEIFGAIDGLFGVHAIRPVPPTSAAVTVELDPNETRWRLLFDALDEGVIVVDADARIGTTNHAATTLLGIPTSQIIGRSIAHLLVDAKGRPFDAGRLDPITETLRSGRPRSGVIVGTRRSDGARAWLSVNVRPLAAAGPNESRGAIASLNDVTAVRALRRELAAADLRTQCLLDASPTAVLVVAKAGGGNHSAVDHRVVWGNEAALAGTGWHIGTRLRESPGRRGAPGAEAGAGLLDLVAEALDRACAPIGRRDVRCFRSGDDEIILTWVPLAPRR
jgi:PAS domain S-box-containing protein